MEAVLIGEKPIFVHTSIIVGKEEEREESGRGTSSHLSHNTHAVHPFSQDSKLVTSQGHSTLETLLAVWCGVGSRTCGGGGLS